MTRNPAINALLALSYIVLLVSAVFYGPTLVTLPNEDMFGILIPVAFLSLFVFSAALMGFIFLYKPLLLLAKGEKEQAAKLFLQTLGFFAGFVLTLVAIGFTVALSRQG